MNRILILLTIFGAYTVMANKQPERKSQKLVNRAMSIVNDHVKANLDQGHTVGQLFSEYERLDLRKAELITSLNAIRARLSRVGVTIYITDIWAILRAKGWRTIGTPNLCDNGDADVYPPENQDILNRWDKEKKQVKVTK